VWLAVFMLVLYTALEIFAVGISPWTLVISIPFMIFLFSLSISGMVYAIDNSSNLIYKVDKLFGLR